MKIPVRVFDCGHTRPDDVRALVKAPYQKVGELGYCRVCMKERTIVNVI